MVGGLLTSAGQGLDHYRNNYENIKYSFLSVDRSVRVRSIPFLFIPFFRGHDIP